VNFLNKSNKTALVWSAILIVLLLSFISPFNIVTVNFIMVPILVLYMRLDLKKFILSYALSLLVLYLLTGGLGLVLMLLPLFFLPTVLVMGRSYKKQAPARVAVLSGVLTQLGVLLAALLAFRVSGLNLIDEFRDTIKISLETLPELWKPYMTPDFVDKGVLFVVQLIPFFLAAFSIYFVLLTHAVGTWLLRRSGLVMPRLAPIRNWRIPKSLVWYYLVAVILDFLLAVPPESFIAMILINLLPLLTIAFAVQAVSFLFHIVHIKRKSKWLPITAIVLMLFFPPLLYVFSMLGLIDAMFPIRERLANK
jgi:uncharacterized protein YybS (DUF2232 family)